MKFEQILKLRRKRLGKNQRDVAAWLEIAPTNVSDYERGNQIPSVGNLMVLCEKLKLNAAQLLGQTDIPADLLFSSKEEAESAGYQWDEPIPAEPAKPYEATDQEPGRFLMRVNLEDCELLTAFNQMDSRGRRTLLGAAHDILQDVHGRAAQAQ